MATGSFSHAIAEGDRISVVAAVEDADSARSAEAQRAEALVVTANPAAVRDATSLPILWRGEIPFDLASSAADAVMIVFDGLDDDDGRLEPLHRRAGEFGPGVAGEVRDGQELEPGLGPGGPDI